MIQADTWGTAEEDEEEEKVDEAKKQRRKEAKPLPFLIGERKIGLPGTTQQLYDEMKEKGASPRPNKYK